MAAITASLPEKCLCREVEEFPFSGAGNRHQLWLCSWSTTEPICILQHFAGEHPSANCKNINFSSFIFRMVLFGAIPILRQEPSHSMSYCMCKRAVQVEVPQLPVQLHTVFAQGSSSGWRPQEIMQHSKRRNKSSVGAEHCFNCKKHFPLPAEAWYNDLTGHSCISGAGTRT